MKPEEFITLGKGSYCGVPVTHFGGRVFVGNYTSIASNVTFLTGPGVKHPTELNKLAVSNYCFGKEYAGAAVYIGSDVLIGTGAIIFGGVIIGDGAIVGAGAIIKNNVGSFQIATGNPATHRPRFDDHCIAALLRIRWWDWPEAKIQAALPFFNDIKGFVERYDVTTEIPCVKSTADVS